MLNKYKNSKCVRKPEFYKLQNDTYRANKNIN